MGLPAVAPSAVAMAGMYWAAVLCLLAPLVVGDCPGDCLNSNCTLPECHCADVNNNNHPNNLQGKPQIVLLTFDDAITEQHYDDFTSQIIKRTNPNGCPIGATFFLTHKYSDYRITHKLWNARQEIALHSITHTTGTDHWKTMNQSMWEYEMVDLRTLISHFANIPEGDIYGMRAPYLQINGDETFRMIENNGVEYDCSMPTYDYSEEGLFPYTLDYRSEQDCQIKPCPKECHKGVWVVPMNDWEDLQGKPCAMFDACPNRPEDKAHMLEMMHKNFDKHYTTNRAPFAMFTHIAMLQGFPFIWEAYNEFLDYLQELPDVYMVSVHQAVEWMKDPVLADVAKDFAPWKTQCDPLPYDCKKETEAACKLVHPGEWSNETMYLKVCGDCPAKYPWLLNPLGE